MGLFISKQDALGEITNLRVWTAGELDKYAKVKDFKSKDDEHSKALGLIRETITEFKKTFVRL